MPGSDLNDIERAFGAGLHHQSPVLLRAGFRHAFFTRLGGASEGPFRSLSFSTAVGDEPRHVEENLRRAGALLGVEPSRIAYLSQVHGREARFFREPQLLRDALTLEGDAIGGSDPGSAYGVRSADCVPILLADTRSGAVMAIHAGWRGVVRGAVEAGAACLLENAPPGAELLAAIGPHISRAAFEVSEDVAAELEAACPVPGAVTREAGAKPHVDLRFIVTRKLLALGLNEASVDQVGGCTFLDPEHYFSFRRDGKASGRHLSAIVPRA
ncbi:MAG: polyphenol oxidase [Myxococcales bacterium]|nr:MAG: polyphenol oxidase [Myxococcales bacterium]